MLISRATYARHIRPGDRIVWNGRRKTVREAYTKESEMAGDYITYIHLADYTTIHVPANSIITLLE